MPAHNFYYQEACKAALTFRYPQQDIQGLTLVQSFQDLLLREKAQKQMILDKEKDFRKLLTGSIDLCNWYLFNREPFSDDWCFAQNTIQWLYHVYDTKYIEGEEVSELDVYRKYQQVRQRFIT